MIDDTFSHYVKPTEVFFKGQRAHIGLGRVESGQEFAYVGIGDDTRYGSALLSRVGIDQLISSLVLVRNEMESR